MADTAANPKAFIFDCDGTLLDSMGMWLSIQPEFINAHGIQVTADDFARFEHLSLEEECRAYHDVWGICSSGEEVFEQMDALLRQRYAHAIESRRGVRSFLDEARRAGIPMCIASSTPRHLLEIGLERNGLLDYFCGITTTGEVERPKGFPDVYDLALKRLCSVFGTEEPHHGEVWVFEDAYFGLKGAGDGGYRRVGIFDPAGRSKREDVRSECEVFIDEFEDLSLDVLLAYRKGEA